MARGRSRCRNRPDTATAAPPDRPRSAAASWRQPRRRGRDRRRRQAPATGRYRDRWPCRGGVPSAVGAPVSPGRSCSGIGLEFFRSKPAHGARSRLSRTMSLKSVPGRSGISSATRRPASQPASLAGFRRDLPGAVVVVVGEHDQPLDAVDDGKSLQRAVRERRPGRPQRFAAIVQPGGGRERRLQPFADRPAACRPATAAPRRKGRASCGRSSGRRRSARCAESRSAAPLIGLRISASRQGCRVPGPNTQFG